MFSEANRPSRPSGRPLAGEEVLSWIYMPERVLPSPEGLKLRFKLQFSRNGSNPETEISGTRTEISACECKINHVVYYLIFLSILMR